MFKCVSAIESLDHSKKRRQLISFCSTLLSTGCWRIPWPWLLAIQWFRFFQLFVPVIEIDKVPKLRWKLTLSLIYFVFSFFSLSWFGEKTRVESRSPPYALQPNGQVCSFTFYLVIAPSLPVYSSSAMAGWLASHEWDNHLWAGNPPSVKLLF